MNDPELALPYFLQAAQDNPNYVYQSVNFREGIWTYVGRTQYATKRYVEARQSLERALAVDPNDQLARLYFGLTLARSGEAARGTKEILSAMRGLHDWLEYMNRSRPFEAYWDPLREIRKAIEIHVPGGPGNDAVTSEQLIPDAEWLGNKMEDEIERVRQDERRQFERNFDRSRGTLGWVSASASNRLPLRLTLRVVPFVPNGSRRSNRSTALRLSRCYFPSRE